MRKNLLIPILILLVYNTTLMANSIQSLCSPNNMIELVINQEPKHITAIIKYKDKTVIPEIRLGLQEQNQTFHDNIKSSYPRTLYCNSWKKKFLQQHRKYIHNAFGEFTEKEIKY